MTDIKDEEHNTCNICGKYIEDDREICESCEWDIYNQHSYYDEQPSREMLIDAEII